MSIAVAQSSSKQQMAWRDELLRRLPMMSCFMMIMVSHHSENGAHGQFHSGKMAAASSGGAQARGEVAPRAIVRWWCGCMNCASEGSSLAIVGKEKNQDGDQLGVIRMRVKR